MHSCIFRGRVRHSRPAPAHRFEYSTSWIYLDLDEADQVVRSHHCLSRKRFAAASFRRCDHFGDPQVPLAQTVAEFVHDKTGLRFGGPIRLLTQLRHFGFYFSPINVFYCFDQHESLAAVVAEVSNTPWNERHCYVLWEGNRIPGSTSRYSHAKEFHVSPFMGMDSQYEWRIQAPTEKLHLALGCRRDGDQIFHADLHLNRSELSDLQLVRTMLRRPIAAAHIVGAIYYQALRLWMKKCQFFPHPRTLQQVDSQAVPSPMTSEPKRRSEPQANHKQDVRQVPLNQA